MYKLAPPACEPVDAGMQLDEVARQYRAALKTYFRRRGMDHHECDDLAQEVLFRLARRTGLGAIPWVAQYVFRTAATVLADHHRQKVTRGEHVTRVYEESAHAPEDFSPERVLLGQEALERAREVIRLMPERTRQAFVLYRFQRLRQAEIAEQMGISVSAVEKLVRQGITRLAAGMVEGE